ncbi:MAG: cytochrome C, partial [Desulfuromonadales bacterium]|nr:cytochrome C [Desulfuromonadales bacterium]
MGTISDIGNSNVCVKCHGGRGNQQTMIDDNNSGRVHYLAATGTLYGDIINTGYEFGGLDYAKPSFFKHDLIRLNGDSPETGAGPCSGCHMGEGAGHTFNVVTKDEATDNIMAINTQTVCDECHSSLTAGSLQTSSDGYQDALDLLQTNLVGSPANNDELGATHNYNYLSGEPGAYAHNSRYAKRLIFDALDYLDNATLNGNITIDTALYPDAAVWYGAEASGIALRP